MKELFQLSVSQINSFQKCPMLWKFQSVDRIVPIEETDSLRIGTNWHKLKELTAGLSEIEAKRVLTDELFDVYDSSLCPASACAGWLA